MEIQKQAGKSLPDKDTCTDEEVKEHFQGPDTSSLTAFLLSLFSRSESGLQCSNEPISSDLHNVSEQPTSSTSWLLDRKSQRRIRDSTSQGFLLQQGSYTAHCMNFACACEPEDDESEWQLITDNDLQDSGNGPVSGLQKQEIVLPETSDTSVILPESLRSSLYLNLPTLVRGREWVLLYSTWKHGISLLTLYRRSSYLSGPCLLVAEDSKGTIFGGLLSSPLNPTTKRKFQGTTETFVFTNISRELNIFHPTGLNRYFLLCTKDALAFGGGSSFALHLDGDLLHGSSGHSETFGNCCLAHAEEFTVRNVELWGFAHTSKYVSREASFKEPKEAPGICRW